jgi:low affinity Fe/Cu permease
MSFIPDTNGAPGEVPMHAMFSKFASATSHAMGKPVTFIAALTLVVVWAISGPFFDFSEVWQLVINTGTTIITFLMIFVLQNSQNRDSEALQAKLDELILTSRNAQNRFIGIERLDEKELRELKQLLERRASENADEDPNSALHQVERKRRDASNPQAAE